MSRKLENLKFKPEGHPKKKDGGECFAPLVRSLEEPWNGRTHEIFGLGLSLKGRALRSNLGTLHFLISLDHFDDDSKI